jgi:rubrerythrin
MGLSIGGTRMYEEIDVVEVFKIAEKVERDGAAFYQKAAQLFHESDLKSTFLELADWELGHEKLFAQMRKQLSQAGYEVKNSANSEYKVLAGLNVFAMNSDPAGQLHPNLTKEQVIKKAIANERDTIVYYIGLNNFVSEPTAKNKIDEIIKQEKAHIITLTKML